MLKCLRYGILFTTQNRATRCNLVPKSVEWLNLSLLQKRLHRATTPNIGNLADAAGVSS